MDTPEIKNIYKWAWIVLIILAVFLGVQTLLSLKGLRETSPAHNSITVTGEGEAFAIPDLATFSFSVSAEAKTVSVAQEEVTKKVEAVMKALTDLGIEEKDIKTSDYSVWPKYVYSSQPCTPNFCPPSQQTQDGFTASHSVSVKVRDTEKAGEALAVAGANGATNLSSISFTVDDPDQITEEAREIAIEDAREQAEKLADELGVKLGAVVTFSEGRDGDVMPFYREVMAQAGNASAEDKAVALPMGENKVKIVVSVTYEIR
jgi:uncharacterized protein YggE